MRLPKKPPQFHNIVVVSVHIITRKLTAYTTNEQTKSKRYVGWSDYSTKVPRAPHVSTCTWWDDDPSRYIWAYSILQQQGHNGYRWRREWCVGGCGDILPLSHASTKWLSSSLFHKSSLAQLNLWRSPALHPLITRSHVFRTARDVLWQPCGSWATVSAWFVFWDVSRIPSSTVPCLGFRLSGAYSSGLTQACDCEVSSPPQVPWQRGRERTVSTGSLVLSFLPLPHDLPNWVHFSSMVMAEVYLHRWLNLQHLCRLQADFLLFCCLLHV